MGSSIPPQRNFTLDFFDKDAKYAKNLMTSIGKGSFSILGWSDGGISALILAANYQKCVEKLVIWGANSYVNAQEIKLYEGIRDVQKWSQRMREPMEKIYGVAYFPKLWSAWIDAILAIYKQKGGNFCKEKLSQIVSPTLIVHGKKDPMVHPEHIPYLLENIKRAKYFEFPEGKHNIHLRYADEFNRVVADFISR